MTTPQRTLTAAAVASVSGGGATVLLASIQRLVASGPTALDEIVAVGVQTIGLAILLWYLATAVIALACLGARSAGAVWVAGERGLARSGAPLARRLLGVGAGVAVAAAAVVAPAAAATAPAFELSDDLGWGATQDAEEPEDSEPSPSPSETATQAPPPQAPSPDTSTQAPPPTGGSGSGARPSATAPAQPPSQDDPAPSSYVVVAGDTLWDIAADHLPPAAAAGDIAVSWPQWYELNRDVVGPDPDLIHPGQVLVAPDPHTEEGA